jgi:hypothetical protein
MRIHSSFSSGYIQPHVIKWLSNPLSGRCSIYLRDTVMVAGVAFAALGAVGSFLVKAKAVGSIFSLVSVTLLYATYYVHNYYDTTTLQNDLHATKTQNTQLIETQRKTQERFEAMTNKVKMFEQGMAILMGTVTQFSETATDLAKSANTPILSSPSLTSSPLMMSMKSLSSKTQAEVDQNIVDLSLVLVNAQETTQNVVSTLNERNTRLAKKVKEYETGKKEVQDLRSTSTQQTNQLQLLQIDVETKKQELGHIVTDICTESATLARTKHDSAAVTAKLEQATTSLAKVEKQLQEATQKHNEFLERVPKAEAAIRMRFEALKKEKSDQLNDFDRLISVKKKESQEAQKELEDLRKQRSLAGSAIDLQSVIDSKTEEVNIRLAQIEGLEERKRKLESEILLRSSDIGSFRDIDSTTK